MIEPPPTAGKPSENAMDRARQQVQRQGKSRNEIRRPPESRAEKVGASANTPARIAYRLDEIAAALGISRRSLERRIAEGDRRASRVGRVVVVLARDLEAFLAQTRIGHLDEAAFP